MTPHTPDIAPVIPIAWHRRASEEVFASVRSSPNGLSSQDAAQRLIDDGPNALDEAAKTGTIKILVAQFKSLIIWILIIAGIVSGLLGERVDAIAILSIVVLNAAVGFYQEFNAAKSIAALKHMTAPHAKVRRGGKVTSIDAAAIVVGDVLFMEAGDLVPADARLIEASALKCIESALTGESEAVTKASAVIDQEDVPLGDRANMVFMATSVAAGTGVAVVVATAMKTELGHIAGLLQAAGKDKSTPLQKTLDSFGRVLVWAALGVVALLFVLGLLRGVAPLELFMTSISLAVAAVPEGLPATVTVALAVGVTRMSRRHALIRKLAAVETLGSTSVICTDKTGTLTVGEMTVRALYVAGKNYEVTGEGYGPIGEVRIGGAPVNDQHRPAISELATIFLGCNNAHLVEEAGVWKTVGDPTEGALLTAGRKAGVDRAAIERDWPRKAELPFDSDRKRSTTIRRRADGRLRAFINGAPGPLLALCTHMYDGVAITALTDAQRKQLLDQTSSMAKKALRVLGSAYRDLDAATSSDLSPSTVERDLVFVGLSGMHDPPRPEGEQAIAACYDASIRVVMITGDHPHTAAAIAGELGIATDTTAVTGVQLDAMAEEELARRLSDIAVYARVSAQNKLRIVTAFQQAGEVVAMTGDGVNDAPAIKGADIGIAMGKTGTEVTKQAADMIITDDNFATIVAAVEEGRGIYDNIRKTLQYLLAGNTGELLLMTVCVVIGLPAPLLAIHLLWINLVTDGLPALCLATDPIDRDVMKQAPRKRSDRLTDGGFLWTMALTGLLTASVAFGVYLYVLKTSTLEVARTSAFAVLVFSELLRAFGARSDTKPVWRMPLFANRNLALVIAISIGIQLWSHHSEVIGRVLKTSPLSLTQGIALLLLGAIPLLVLDLIKVARVRSKATKVQSLHGQVSP